MQYLPEQLAARLLAGRPWRADREQACRDEIG
jgi:hypothetical protein